MTGFTEPLIDVLKSGFEDIARRELGPIAVAVIDTGVDGSHPDLAGRVIGAYSYDATTESVIDGDPTQNNDVRGHGTAVAHIISRAAPNTTLIDLRALRADHTGSGEELIMAFEHALTLPVRIINMSLAAQPKYQDKLAKLCERAYRQNKIVVAASRNQAHFVGESPDRPLGMFYGLPAELSACISVDIHSEDVPFSVYFQRHVVEFAAFGDGVKAAQRGGGYTTVVGTSFATPAISGLCALMLGVWPELRLFELKTILKALADKHTGD